MATFEGIELKMMQFTINTGDEKDFENIKLIKFYDDIQPFVLVKNNILNNSDILSWNTRQLVMFNFEDGISLPNNNVGKIITQYTDITIVGDNYDFQDYSVFKILKLKNVGSSTFKNIQEPIIFFDSNGNVSGTQFEDINITENSFDLNLPSLKIDFFKTNNYFMFRFKCISTKSLLFNTNEVDNVNFNHEFENMIYIYNNNFTTGFSNASIESTMKFKLLMTNTDDIEIINTTPVSNYNILFNNTSSNIISQGTTTDIIMYIQIINGVTNSKINLRFVSNDIIFNTFVPLFKQVGNNQYLLSSRPSGLNPDVYIFNVSVFKISAVDSITRSTTSVISLNGSREIEIFIEPDLKLEYFGGSTPLVQPLIIRITNENPQIFSMTNEVVFPNVISILDLSNTFFTITSTSNPDNLNNALSVRFEVITGNSLFQNITIPSLSIQVASIVSNSTKCFINTADGNIKYNPNIVISTAPGTIEDLSSASLIGINSQTPITPQTYNFTVKIIDNEFVIDYNTDLQVEPINRRFSLIQDISFQAFENDIYIFDTSHPSNQNHLLSFFTSNTINSNNELLTGVVYDDNINQGEPGSKITLTIPPNSQYSSIFMSDFPSGENKQTRVTGICKINIQPNPTNINIGTFYFTLLQGGGTSSMSLVPNINGNNIPVQGINNLDIEIDENATDANRILELFSGEKRPIPTITVNSIYLDKPENVRFEVFNKTFILLNWNVNNSNIYEFANPRESRYTISVYYNIYREDADTENTILLATTTLSTYTDTTALNFNNYNYYIESVAMWEGLTMTSQRSDPLFVFVCENNRFPDGRWNNSFSNPKLYKQLSTCSTRNNITTNLFPNSWSLSKKQTYARLAKLSINKR